jgi:hypothetical protein
MYVDQDEEAEQDALLVHYLTKTKILRHVRTILEKGRYLAGPAVKSGCRRTLNPPGDSWRR